MRLSNMIISAPATPKATTTPVMVIPSLEMSPSSTSTASSASYKENFGKELCGRSEKEEKLKTNATGDHHSTTKKNLERILSFAVEENSTKNLETNISAAGTNGETQYCHEDDDDDDEEVGSTSTCAGTVCLTLDGATNTDDAFVAPDQEKEESTHPRRRRTDPKVNRPCVPMMATESSGSSTSSTTEFFRALLEQPTRVSSSTTSGKSQNHRRGGRRARRPLPQNERRRQFLLKLARYLQAKTVPVNVSIPPMNEPETAIPTWRMFYEHSESLDKTLQPLLELLSYDDDSISSMKTVLSTTIPSSSSPSFTSRHRILLPSPEGTTTSDNTTTLGSKQKKSRSVERFRVVENKNLKAGNEVRTISATTVKLSDNFDDRGYGDNEDDDREWTEEYYNLRRSERILRRELLRVDDRMARRRRRWGGSHNDQAVDSRNDNNLSTTSNSSKLMIDDMSMMNTSDRDVCVLQDDEQPPFFCSYIDSNDGSLTQTSTTVVKSSKKVFPTKNRVSRKVVSLIGKTILSLTGIKILLHLQQQHQLQHLHQPLVDRKIRLPRDIAIDLDILPQQIPNTNRTSNWSKIPENDDGVDKIDAGPRTASSNHSWKRMSF